MKKLLLLSFLFLSAFTFVKTPTLDEFIASDKTNEVMFIEDVFDCQQFTDTFVKNARLSGLDAQPVYAGLSKNGTVIHHMFVEVKTPEGIFWVEPQLDLYYQISEVGKPLCLLDGRCVTQDIVYLVTEKDVSQ